MATTAPAKKAPTKKAPARKAPARKAPAAKVPAKRTPATKAPTTRAPGASTPGPVAVPTVAAKPERTGPVLGAYRLGLTSLEKVTTGVGGLALGSLGYLGLPKKFAGGLKSTHRKAIHGASRASDVVGTKAAKGAGRTVAAAAGVATYVFP